MYSGRLDADSGGLKAAEAARAAPPAPAPPRSIDLVLDGLARRCTEGPAAGVPPLRLALEAVSNEALDDHGEILRWLMLSPVVQSMTVFELWDDDAFRALATRAVQLARDTGALALLPVALVYRSGVHVYAGELAAAAALTQEADAIAVATGNAPLMFAWLVLDAWRGVEAEAMRAHQTPARERRRARERAGAGRLRRRHSQQRPGPIRGGDRRRQARQRRRRLGLRGCVPAGARRGGDPLREAGRRRRRAGAAGRAHAAPRARTGRSASWPGHAH